MSFQTIIVAVIISAACLYIARIAWLKTKSFSPKSSCSADCGCDAKQKNKAVKI